MTLTLEDVKNVRFPIAKRVGEGYRATEVDDFVDRVDATFATMLEENERLKGQLGALDGSGTKGGGDDLAEENQRLRAELDQARKQTSAAGSEELSRLRAENEQLRAQAGELRGQLESARQSTGLTVMEGNQDGSGRVEKIVVTTAAQASPAVTRLVQLATEQAEAVVSEARDEAQRTVQDAQAKAERVTLDATTRAESIESAARVEADRLNQQARANSDAVNAEAQKRRHELFGELEGERDQLVQKVNGLRAFESDYRTSLANHLAAQLEQVRQTSLEPADAPELAGGSQSSTPRLDALVAEGRSAS